MFKRGRLAALIAFLALGLAAVPALPAQAEDGIGMDVSGTVTIYDDSVNQHRQPLANAKVCEGGPDSNCAITDDKGRYTLTNVVGQDRGAGFNEVLPTVFLPMTHSGRCSYRRITATAIQTRTSTFRCSQGRRSRASTSRCTP